MRRAILAAVVLLFAQPAAGADFYDGNALFDACRQKDSFSFSDGVCFGFVAGVSGAHDEQLFCLPNKVAVKQAVDVVILWLETHPEKRHLSASSLVLAALQEGFPCN